jgi:hypothetical protein
MSNTVSLLAAKLFTEVTQTAKDLRKRAIVAAVTGASGISLYPLPPVCKYGIASFTALTGTYTNYGV